MFEDNVFNLIPIHKLLKLILFRESCETPYLDIDNANQSLMELEELYEKFRSQTILFEIPQPESNTLESTKNSLRLNKQLWNFVHIVKGWIDVWKSTLWSNIDSELMDMELKRFAKELRGTLQNYNY